MAGLLVIDMQAGLFTPETPRYDAEWVVTRINAVADAVRRDGGAVVFIQHDGPLGDTFEPGTASWQLLPTLVRKPQDAVVRKTACDAFYRTGCEQRPAIAGDVRLISVSIRRFGRR